MREQHHRSRDRDHRDRRDTSRDRRRRDASTDSKRSYRRRDSRERVPTRTTTEKNNVCPSYKVRTYYLTPSPQAPKAAPSGVSEEEKKKIERLARLEAWKQKQKATEQQKDLQSVTSTRGLLDEIDKKAAASPVTALSPQSPATPAAPAESTSPAPYAGKFDPKAIAKRATAASAAATKLGTDISMPGQSKPSATLNSTNGSLKANKSLAPAVSSSSTFEISLGHDWLANNNDFLAQSSVPLKARGNVSGFGLATKQEQDKPAAKRGLDFEEEEGSRKKLEKLPTPPPENGTLDEDAMLANGTKDEEEDDDVDMEDGTEEEAAAAARAAAEKREERLQAQSLAYQAGESSEATTSGTPQGEQGTEKDATMVDVKEPEPAVELEEEEEVDPLDAFMTDLTDTSRAKPLKSRPNFQKKAVQAPEAMFGDDEVDINTVDVDPDDILAMASKRKKKDIPAVDHSKVPYESFPKSFYIEPSDLKDLNEDDVTELRAELDNIKVRGTEVPKPAVKWSQCGLTNQIQNVISTLNYEKPSSIQSQAIPAIMSGRDVIGVAKTGSGKTVAFLLPMFRHIKAQRDLKKMEGPIALIMTPTRELATQIHKDCKPFLKALDLRAVCAYGGAPIKDQIGALKTGAHIVVCTPGRMIDLLAANSGKVTNLRRVTYVVLDEADRMFDMGFEPQVMKILGNIRPDRQTVLFSATFPRQMEALARKTLTKPIEIVVGGRSVVAPEITQIVEVREENTKFVRLLELLGLLYEDEKNEDDRVLIFVDRQESADGLLSELLRKGYPCGSIHGGKDQVDRDSTIQDFKAGGIPIMTATSVAARGLDVKQLKLVVNYDAPNHLEDYVHRAGRTGRAGNTGTAVTFITEEQDRYSVDIAKALKQSGQPVPQDLQNLVDKFMDKVKTGKEKASGSGFGGKGLEKLDQERDAARNRERKAYKTGDDVEEEEKDEAKDGGDDIIKNAASVVQSASAPTPLPGVPKGIDLDGKITVIKSGSGENPLEKVSQAVASITNRLSNTRVLRQGVPIDNKGPDAGAFHATLEINDFPQKARWAVTNRTNVAKILEATGTSITTKGSFYAAGKEPPAGGEPKLYILVEGDTEVVVTNAMRELMRLLKEGTMAAADSDARAPASGRYNVV